MYALSYRPVMDSNILFINAATPKSSIRSSFCGGEQNLPDCTIEYLVLLWPYYIYFLILFPVRVYEIRLISRSYPPQWWPLSHLAKRALVIAYITAVSLWCFLLLMEYGRKGVYRHVYLMLSWVIHVTAWSTAYWLIDCEYKRYQPLTWFGLRGFWVLTGLEGVVRLEWTISAILDDSIAPDYIIDGPIGWYLLLVATSSVVAVSMLFTCILIPNDLNVNLLGHIQRILFENRESSGGAVSNDATVNRGGFGDLQKRHLSDRPSRKYSTTDNESLVYTLHEEEGEDKTNIFNRSDKVQSKRADTPGWIYSVEEELPFKPKIDIVNVSVLAVSRGMRIRTMYRIQTRVTSSTEPPAVMEFNAKRRYKHLRSLNDKLRSIFNHSDFPEQRASLGNFPPREVTQADPFARQIAFKEYFRRLSQSPIYYTKEFLDMVGIDPEYDSGKLYQSCLDLQRGEASKWKKRKANRVKEKIVEGRNDAGSVVDPQGGNTSSSPQSSPGQTPEPMTALAYSEYNQQFSNALKNQMVARLTAEPLPWRQPLMLTDGGASSSPACSVNNFSSSLESPLGVQTPPRVGLFYNSNPPTRGIESISSASDR